MIVGTCSFGSTGSSAVSDYLKEFDSLQVIDKCEFTWVSAPDGLIDLDYHLNHPHSRTGDSIYAIARYKALCKSKSKVFATMGIGSEIFMKSVDELLESITTTSWKWIGPNIGQRSYFEDLLLKVIRKSKLITKWEIKNGQQWEGYPYEDVFLSVYPKDFDQMAKKHVMDIINSASDGSGRDIILDQPFPGSNPQSCFKYFDDPYAIVVDRDPRDNYTFARTHMLHNPGNHFMPINSVERFVKYYRALRDNQPYKEDNPRVLRLHFEDMVYHYEDSTSTIRKFLNLPENPNPKSIFDPAISMPNTQVWKRFPQFAKDIEYIEKELPEYLFDFKGCPEPDPNGKMFFGKSPKNKA